MSDADTEPAPIEPLPGDDGGEPAVIEIVLVGAGHAHLQVVEQWPRRGIRGSRLILLSAFDRAAYSGMVPGALVGAYRPHEFKIDLASLTDRCGVELIVDRAVALDPAAKRITCAHHPSISYDIASINIGSMTQGESLCQMHRNLVSVKPLVTFGERLERRLGEWRSQQHEGGTNDPLRMAMIGAGAAGVELALCLNEMLKAASITAELTLVDSGSRVWSSAGRRARHRALSLLGIRKIQVRVGRRVVDCDEDGPPELVLDDGGRLPFDIAIWATGAAPHTVTEQFGLPTSERGFLLSRPTLQSTAYDNVLITGDAADPVEGSIPKAGVYAVRQGPVLLDNLSRLAAGKPLKDYEPQRAYLSLLNCGDGTAILDYKGWSSHSRWAWWLKRWIDRRFVRRFQ